MREAHLTTTGARMNLEATNEMSPQALILMTGAENMCSYYLYRIGLGLDSWTRQRFAH
jgi:hypothetical protein